MTKGERQAHKSRGPRTIPNQVQLPGGIILKAMPFKIVAYNDDGTPKLFELLPAETRTAPPDACVLFAHEEWIRSPVPGKVAT